MTPTPKQVEQVERWLAEKVMGWKLGVDCTNSRWFIQDGSDRHWHWREYEEDWQPCSNPTHAAMAREKAQSQGYRWVLSCGFRNNRDGNIPFFLGSFTITGYASPEPTEAPTEHLASSLALALATGWKPEEDPSGKA